MADPKDIAARIRSMILAEGHERVAEAVTPEQQAKVLARAFVGALGDLCAIEPGSRTLYLPELALALEVEPGLADTIKWICNLEPIKGGNTDA